MIHLLGGADTADAAASAAAVTVDLGLNTASGFAIAANIENVTGGTGSDTLTGSGLANVLNGGVGNDTLNGGADNDTLNGGADNDLFVASVGDGNDTINGGTQTDTYDLSATTAGAVITTTSSTSAETGLDTLLAIENFLGSQGDDSITTNGGVNVIDGQGGHDTINAGLGNDILNGDAGNDIFNYVIGDDADAVNGRRFSDTLNIRGTAGANTLAVTFNGTALTSVAGGTLTGVETVTIDLLGGTDTLNYAGSAAAVTVDLGLGTASGFTTAADIENVTGGTGGDTLTGSGLANVLIGGAGADGLSAGAGADTLNGGQGNDRLNGGADNDTLNGGADDDLFVAAMGDGNDAIDGGGGIDTYDLSAYDRWSGHHNRLRQPARRSASTHSRPSRTSSAARVTTRSPPTAE